MSDLTESLRGREAELRKSLTIAARELSDIQRRNIMLQRELRLVADLLDLHDSERDPSAHRALRKAAEAGIGVRVAPDDKTKLMVKRKKGRDQEIVDALVSQKMPVIAALEGETQDVLETVEQNNIIEGEDKSDDADLPDPTDFEDNVASILAASGEPMHITEIRDSLLSRHVPIPGRGSPANIITRMRRSNGKFIRFAPGTYALAEWNLEPMRPKRKRRRKSAKRSKKVGG